MQSYDLNRVKVPQVRSRYAAGDRDSESDDESVTKCEISIEMSELNWLKSPVVTVGASGKALLCGGYLVLEHPNIGITIASTSKFYTTVCKLNDNICSANGASELVIKVESPQFYTSFEYKYDYVLNELTMLGTTR